MTDTYDDRQPLTTDQANAVYDILIRHAGGEEHDRDTFVYSQTSRFQPEYRFMGGLGFGGKFRRNRDGIYVDGYFEDVKDRPDRQRAIDVTNAALAGLRASWVGLAAALGKGDHR